MWEFFLALCFGAFFLPCVNQVFFLFFSDNLKKGNKLGNATKGTGKYKRQSFYFLGHTYSINWMDIVVSTFFLFLFWIYSTECQLWNVSDVKAHARFSSKWIKMLLFGGGTIAFNLSGAKITATSTPLIMFSAIGWVRYSGLNFLLVHLSRL